MTPERTVTQITVTGLDNKQSEDLIQIIRNDGRVTINSTNVLPNEAVCDEEEDSDESADPQE